MTRTEQNRRRLTLWTAALATVALIGLLGCSGRLSADDARGRESRSESSSLTGVWVAPEGFQADDDYSAVQFLPDGRMTRGVLKPYRYVPERLMGDVKMLDPESFTVGEDTSIYRFNIDGRDLTLQTPEGEYRFVKGDKGYFDSWRAHVEGLAHRDDLVRLLEADESESARDALIAAEADLKKSISALPSNRSPVFDLAFAYNLGAQYFDSSYDDKAIELGSRWARENPTEGADVRYCTAVAYRNKGQRTRAIQLLKEALQLDSDYEPAQQLLRELE